MAIVRFDPFRGIDPFQEISLLQREMNRLFDSMVTTDERSGSEVASTGYSFLPAAEISETPEQIELKVEVPGLEAKDLDIKVTNEAVAIAGERKSEIKHQDKGMSRSEFRYGRFQRIIPLPTRIQNDKVQAEFKNGVLCLTLPKAEEERNKVVQISLDGQNNQALSGRNGQSNQAELQAIPTAT
ncbi:MAG: Hsp20/alpha crystallin family protein [Cyanomargarita calcarea GSE-NOS-MK-12-04C]|jgi:HSP20 family protein|uniref:Hsp20/alpha crystallin family protein n=1 Tax=Cyanomargarita calcarea GSE-NOS-MK-12-04C TaxID=2839659 RepID=A0A951USV3_9CYAN|nr:Hsp20/alpha crystallin family protein [Cyanomargarita calcarea GSE-NOS-MK-12-04C]